MHILFLTQIIPYPLDAGPKVKTWNVLRYLINQGHKVTLASFIRPEEQSYLDVVKDQCNQVCTVEIHRSRATDIKYWFRSLFSGRPFLIERDDIPAMRSLIQHILATENIDFIHADQLTMCQYALLDSIKNPENKEENLSTGPVRIFDAHNAVWKIVKRIGQNLPVFLKPFTHLESNRIKKYEGRIVSTFEHTLAVSEQDKQGLIEAAEAYHKVKKNSQFPISVIPIAVNTKELQVVNRPVTSTNIVTMGTLHYPPNADGIRWFIHAVFPLIKHKLPHATLTIIGKNPPDDFYKIAQQNSDSILITGYVPDLNPYLENAGVMVVPVRAGGGMRVRILEAFARGMPVVTTTIGIEGIDACDGEEVVIKDEPTEFADAVVNLIKDREYQNELALKGRILAETQYDWQVVLKKMDAIYLRN